MVFQKLYSEALILKFECQAYIHIYLISLGIWSCNWIMFCFKAKESTNALNLGISKFRWINCTYYISGLEAKALGIPMFQRRWDAPCFAPFPLIFHCGTYGWSDLLHILVSITVSYPVNCLCLIYSLFLIIGFLSLSCHGVVAIQLQNTFAFGSCT